MSLIRRDRINEELKKSASEIIREMKDPRVSGMATIIRAEVTPDQKQAKLFVSVYDNDEQSRKETIAALNHAAGFIGHEIGQRMILRRIPALKFVLDTSIEYSVHISNVLNSLNIQGGDASHE